MGTLLVSSISTAENSITIPEIKQTNEAAANSFFYGDLPEDDYGCLVRELVISTYTDDKGNYRLFKKPLKVQLWYLDDQKIHVAHNSDFNHFDIGKSEAEALKNFLRSFYSVYHSYKNTPLNCMTSDARELLNRLQEYIGTVSSNGTRQKRY